jgi:hypothetical protein
LEDRDLVAIMSAVIYASYEGQGDKEKKIAVSEALDLLKVVSEGPKEKAVAFGKPRTGQASWEAQ